MRIKVVHLVATMRDGGAEAVLRALIPRLTAEPDLDVHVVSVYPSRLNVEETAALKAPLHDIGRQGRADVSFAPRLLATLRRLQPDVVHGHIHTGKYAGRIAAIATGVPSIVFTEHGDEARGFVRWSMKRLLNARTARFIVFTESERQRYALEEGIPLSRIDVIANGIPLPSPIDVESTRRELLLQEGEFAIGNAARFVSQKNQELAIRAVAKLRSKTRRRVRLVLIGDGPDGAALRALVKELHLDEAVHFLGYRVDAQRLVAACDVMALPSRWEKMPLVLGEAMLAGVPVVSAPWTGVDAFIADNSTGYLASDWSVDEFSSALARAIDDPLARTMIASRANQFAQQMFDMERMVDAHSVLYRSLASRLEKRWRR